MNNKITLSTDWLLENQEWVRTLGDDQLEDYRINFDILADRLITSDIDRQAASIVAKQVAGFYQRLDGYSRAIDFLDDMNTRPPAESFYEVMLAHMMAYGTRQDIEDYLALLDTKRLAWPSYQLCRMQAYIAYENFAAARTSLLHLLDEHAQSPAVLKAVIWAIVFDIDFDIETLQDKVPWGARFRLLLHRARTMAAASPPAVAHCINLDKATERWSRCHRIFNEMVDLRRVSAVDGSLITTEQLGGMNINPALPRSALGCSLSHHAVWKTIAEYPDTAPLQVLIEDDSIPVFGVLHPLGAIQQQMQEAGLDVLFIHTSASPLHFALFESSPDWSATALSFEQGLDRFTKYRSGLLPGWGTFGYCITPAGAAKLLELVDRDGFTNHIDWQMFLYSVADWSHPVAAQKNNVVMNYQGVSGRRPALGIRSGILNFPIIDHADFLQSTR